MNRRALSTALFLGVSVWMLQGSPVEANQYRCFGDGNSWCAWTIRESKPEKGWGTISKVRLRSLVVETVIDAQDNVAALRVHVSPVTPEETVSVNLSVREQERDWRRWKNFTGEIQQTDDSTAHFIFSRSALETALEARSVAYIYVFIEVINGKSSYKVSHKISLSALDEALRFARLGGD